MGILSRLFGSPQTNAHRRAAIAAIRVREQAARDMLVEVEVLKSMMRGAHSRHQVVYASGDCDTAGRFAAELEGAIEMLERLERISNELGSEVARRVGACTTAADWEAHATFELEMRGAFVHLREEAQRRAGGLLRLNAQHAGKHRRPELPEPVTHICYD